MRKWILGIVVIFLAIALIGCNSDEENDQQATDDSNEEESSDSSINDDLNLGETGLVESNFGDYEVTVNSFKTQEDFNGEESMSEFF
ncbi:hypothetical protein [Gracilibacillus massiliensis]|uniref:hypothetical protein n=1 Tax=Gracilibacillus massiliensis TaxID=1564956 RepID=UPI00071CCE6F|nr:hypothetical protein [Gracilibacillus massiliensis]